MPVHDLGYREWTGETVPAARRWLVIAQTGIALTWKNPWLRRALFVAWVPAVYMGIGFFFFEKAVEDAAGPWRDQLVGMMQARRTAGWTPKVTRSIKMQTLTIRGTPSRGTYTLNYFDTDGNQRLSETLPFDADTNQLRSALTQSSDLRNLNVSSTGTSPNYEHRFEFVATRRGESFGQLQVEYDFDRGDALMQVKSDLDLNIIRHETWAFILMLFFRYTQGWMIVLTVGMVFPPLIARDLRSRGFLLYFCRPISPTEYVLGKATIIWFYQAMITAIPAMLLYVLGVMLSPDISVVLDTWDLPIRIVLASLVLMIPTTAMALMFTAMTAESRIAGFAWFAVWILGWVAYLTLTSFSASTGMAETNWSALSLYHTLGSVQMWVFGLPSNSTRVASSLMVLFALTLTCSVVLLRRVAAPTKV